VNGIHRRTTQLALMLVAVILAGAPLRLADDAADQREWKQTWEHWYVLELAGATA